ncbi:NAD(P)-binding domain-containing protein [Deinococcus radiophilus]|uniref:NAD(P)-binding domain-containing protein n=1 Tax=Deinococcus radiophilus TaxID=32062 RepID=UPI00361636E5
MKLALIGTGKLGCALLTGLFQRGVLAPQDVGLLSRDAHKTCQVAGRFGAPVIGRGAWPGPSTSCCVCSREPFRRWPAGRAGTVRGTSARWRA